ncbi:DUF4340 domain-containing protein [bacterium]|nr:DUF4340 domain-containing protein [bacterium]
MKRTTIILSAILIIQIIIFSLASIDRHHVQKKEKFISVDSTDADYIKIVNENGELVMRKVGARWKITEPYEWPANNSYIKTLLEKMQALETETYITDNPDKYVLYELDEIAAKYVEFGKQDGIVDKFYCGKASDSYSHTYIRKADTDKVYLVSGSPRSSFSRKPEQWRNKEVLKLDRTMIERMVLTSPGETIELKRSITAEQPVDGGTAIADTSWEAIPSRGEAFVPVDKALNRIMNTLKRFNAISFLDAGIDTIPDFSNPEFTIDVFMEGDQKVKIDFIPKADEETRWIARKDMNESTVFVVYQSSLKNLRKDVPSLKGEEEKEE